MQKLVGLLVLVAVFAAGAFFSDPIRGLLQLGLRHLPFSVAIVSAPTRSAPGVSEGKSEPRLGGLY